MTPTLEQIRYAQVRAGDGRSGSPSYAMERLAAAVLLTLLIPLLLVIALVILVLSRRQPLIRHHRVGWRGRSLALVKFRTMWGNDLPPPRVKRPDDPRVTSRFAAFCRRHSLDELPQLLHVIRGEMSFVGPRPITAEELDQYYGGAAEEILSVRPGLTGLWQIRGRSRLSYARRRRLDLLMVRRGSAQLHFLILLSSLRDIFSGRDAW